MYLDAKSDGIVKNAVTVLTVRDDERRLDSVHDELDPALEAPAIRAVLDTAARTHGNCAPLLKTGDLPVDNVGIPTEKGDAGGTGLLDVVITSPVAISVPLFEGSGEIHAGAVIEPQYPLELAELVNIPPRIGPEPLDILVAFAKVNGTIEIAPIGAHRNREGNERRGDKAVAADEGHVVLRIKTRALDHIGVKRITWMLELTHLLTRRNTAFLSSNNQGISFERKPIDASRASADYKLRAGAQKVISSPLRYTCHDLLKVVENERIPDVNPVSTCPHRKALCP